MNHSANPKALLRTELREKIRLQTLLEKTRAAEKIEIKVRNYLEHSQPKLKRAAIFLATEREPNVDVFARWLQARGVLVCAPHSRENAKPFLSIADEWSNVFLNARGWREPAKYSAQHTADEMDLILVPGLAFDTTGARLGQGGGWYDRALADLPSHVLTIGIAFDFQIVKSVPREAHDQIVSLIITDQRIIEIA